MLKKRTVNAVKPVSKPMNTHFRPYLGKVPPIDAKKLKSAKKKTANAVKLV